MTRDKRLMTFSSCLCIFKRADRSITRSVVLREARRLHLKKRIIPTVNNFYKKITISKKLWKNSKIWLLLLRTQLIWLSYLNELYLSFEVDWNLVYIFTKKKVSYISTKMRMSTASSEQIMCSHHQEDDDLHHLKNGEDYTNNNINNNNGSEEDLCSMCDHVVKTRSVEGDHLQFRRRTNSSSNRVKCLGRSLTINIPCITVSTEKPAKVKRASSSVIRRSPNNKLLYRTLTPSCCPDSRKPITCRPPTPYFNEDEKTSRRRSKQFSFDDDEEDEIAFDREVEDTKLWRNHPKHRGDKGEKKFSSYAGIPKRKQIANKNIR